ncbi:hypothetical protein DOTSEDRAFT_76491 [Dothistroma septosporum NZE10]|uniref:Uncharacterized protein n=1 Tax=Dothistroma septosporum (strain NZE10 / CBS 128990) TaxID=675120 RepID=N1Q059_DOTSN|nr:hypothetical protein DOTSEDRAFT_76491 [Dothistroma septosporum NZE10]
MPRIGELLTQYQMLTSMCDHLSFADVANLAAQFCSDKGLEVQEKIFGPREDLLVIDDDDGGYYDLDPEEKRCLGADPPPSTERGGKVCDVCFSPAWQRSMLTAARIVTSSSCTHLRALAAVTNNMTPSARGRSQGTCKIKVSSIAKSQDLGVGKFDILSTKWYSFCCRSCEPRLQADITD